MRSLSTMQSMRWRLLRPPCGHRSRLVARLLEGHAVYEPGLRAYSPRQLRHMMMHANSRRRKQTYHPRGCSPRRRRQHASQNRLASKCRATRDQRSHRPRRAKQYRSSPRRPCSERQQRQNSDRARAQMPHRRPPRGRTPTMPKTQRQPLKSPAAQRCRHPESMRSAPQRQSAPIPTEA